jgi:hypothetical protein
MTTSSFRTLSTALLAVGLAVLVSAPAQAVPVSPTLPQPSVTIYMPMGFAFGQTFSGSNNNSAFTSNNSGFMGGGGGGGSPSSLWTGFPPVTNSSNASPFLPPASNVSGPQTYSVMPSYVPAPPVGATVSVPDTGATALLLAAALVLVFGFNRRLLSLISKPARARAK